MVICIGRVQLQERAEVSESLPNSTLLHHPQQGAAHILDLLNVAEELNVDQLRQDAVEPQREEEILQSDHLKISQCNNQRSLSGQQEDHHKCYLISTCQTYPRPLATST